MELPAHYLESIPCGEGCGDCPVKELPSDERIIVFIALKNIDEFVPNGNGDKPGRSLKEFVGDALYFSANGAGRDDEKIAALAAAVTRIISGQCENNEQ